jgi:hypothetical protein
LAICKICSYIQNDIIDISGNNCSHSDQVLSYSLAISKILERKIYRNIAVNVCMGVKLAFILMEEFKLRMFNNRVLNMIFGPREDELRRD